MKDWCNPENVGDIHKTMHEFKRLGQLLKDNVRHADPAELTRIRQVLSRAYEDISGG